MLAGVALVAVMLLAGALALDRIFPPDLSRYQMRSSEIVDANGRLLRAFTTADGKWRLKTTADDVDPVYIALLKAYEDRRFDEHWGVDPIAALRAAGQWIERGRVVSGASTISMQAARLLEPQHFHAGTHSLLTKVLQSARALQLEWRYSKREVLAIYLTLAPMGGNLEGVRAASLAYFGKEPQQLSAAEAALLVAIPQSPERRRPDRATHAAQAARNRVLMRGLEHGVIDQPIYDKGVSAPAPSRRLGLPMQAPHLAAWLASQSPGAIVPTTLRYELQAALGQLVADEHAQLADHAQIAMVVVDNRSGGIVAWLGGTDYFGRAGQVDLVRAHRSPGSALKPLIYGLAFDDRVLHPDSIIEDVPVRFREWLPRNFDHEHMGAVTVRRALQQSLNVPAVLTLEKVGPQRFLSTLRTAGVAPGLPPGEQGGTLGIALGSATISPLEMAGLYAGLANGGQFAPPVVRRDQPKPQPVRLMGAAAAWYVADILSEAPLPEGFASLPVALRDRRIAYKTGTSAGYRDAWAAGYSANWTVVVWVGHADGTPRPGQLGRLAALPIVLKAFGRLPAEDNRAFPAPADVLRVASWRELPVRMRSLGPQPDAPNAPRIAYPPSDARIELSAREAVPLSALGGQGRLRWLIDGRPIEGTSWVPDGPGIVRLAVVDDAGHSSAVTVRIVERR
ncbi:MAG: penicillin-binding protein 1C [Alphaproteobacteria bacterium]|nr:penicillin-binding protein 1C [Alphaproteobacteria bacterium]